MKRKSPRKLTLSSKTIRDLSESHLRAADGGRRFPTGDTFTCPPPTDGSCIIICHTL